MSEYEEISVRFHGLALDVTVTPEALKIGMINVVDEEALAKYLESDLRFEEFMQKLSINNTKEELVCQRKKLMQE